MKKKNQKQNKEQQKKQEQVQNKVEYIPPVIVQYCSICTFPYEFCQWGDKPNLCKQWKLKNRPELLSGENVATQNKTQVIKEEVPQIKTQKVQKNKLAYIVFDVKERVKKKYITTIFGLQHFNINSKEFAKKCSKKFACSCNVVDDTKIQIQGDISEDIFDFLEAEYKIKDKYILDNEQYEKKLKKLKQKEKQKLEKQKAEKAEKADKKQQQKTGEIPKVIQQPIKNQK